MPVPGARCLQEAELGQRSRWVAAGGCKKVGSGCWFELL